MRSNSPQPENTFTTETRDTENIRGGTGERTASVVDELLPEDRFEATALRRAARLAAVTEDAAGLSVLDLGLRWLKRPPANAASAF